MKLLSANNFNHHKVNIEQHNATCPTATYFSFVQDVKYGSGGKKRAMKRNTAESVADVSSFSSAKHSKAPRTKTKVIFPIVVVVVS